MQVLVHIFYILLFSYFADYIQFVHTYTILPQFSFQLKLETISITLTVYVIDRYILRLFIPQKNTKNLFFENLIYFPILLLFFSPYCYGKLHFLDRTINSPLKEIKHILYLSIYIICIFKIIYGGFHLLKNKKHELISINKKSIILFLFFIYAFLPLCIIKYYDHFTAGDEKEYILNTYSIVSSRNISIHDDLKYVAFITGGSIQAPPLNPYPEKGKIYSLHSNLFGVYLLYLFPYIIFGRFGLILVSLLAVSFCLSILYKCACYNTGSDSKIAEVYIFFCSLTPFFMIYNQQVYPEIIIAGIIIYFISIIRNENEYIIQKGYIFLLIACPLVIWLNIRYIFFSFTFLFIFLMRFGFKRIIDEKYLLTFVLMCVSIFSFLCVNYSMYESFTMSANTLNMESRFFSLKFYNGLLGIIFDQHFGIIMYMPFAFYIIYEIIRNIRHYKYEMVVFVFYLLPVSFYSGNWFGGYSPPFRLAAPIIPLAFLCGIQVFIKIQKTIFTKIFSYIFAIISVLFSTVLTAVPIFLYNGRLNGNNQFLEKLYWFTGIHIYDYFPVFVPDKINMKSYLLTFIHFCVILLFIFVYRYEEKKCIGKI